MKTSTKVPLLKECLSYTIGVIDFSEVLTEKGKDAIGKRLYLSGINMSCSLHQTHYITKSSEYAAMLKRTLKYIDETVYWLKQCTQSSTYPHNDDLLQQGTELSEQFKKHFSK
jgi:hypothetical protein